MSLARAFGGTEKTDILMDSQKRVVNELGRIVKENLGTGVDPYYGDITPGTNTNLDLGFGSAAGTLLGGDQNLQSTVNSLLSGAGDPAGVRDVYEAQLAPAKFAFEDQMREIRSRYGDTYGKTGALPYMEALGTARFGADQNSLLAQLVYGDRQAAADRSVAGVQGAIGLNNMRSNNLGQLLGIGDMQRTYEAQGNAEDYQKWFGSQAYNNPWLQMTGTLLGVQPKGQQQVAGIVPGTIGALGDIAKMA